MTGLIRPEVHQLVDFSKDTKTYTLRDAVEWYKNFHRAGLGIPSQQELEYMNQRWGVLCEGMAEREGVPASMLSYMLNQIATTEIQLLEVAQEEAAAAKAYGESQKS